MLAYTIDKETTEKDANVGKSSLPNGFFSSPDVVVMTTEGKPAGNTSIGANGVAPTDSSNVD